MCVRVAERWVCVNIGSKGQSRICRINTDGSVTNTVRRKCRIHRYGYHTREREVIKLRRDLINLYV